MKTKAALAAERYLATVADMFMPFLGRASCENGCTCFCFPSIAIDRAELCQRKRSHLFGGFIGLEVVGTVNTGVSFPESKMSILYKGMMVKGDAYFRVIDGNKSAIHDELNANSDLIKTLSELDLEHGEVIVSESEVKVSLAPLGSTYTYMTFPPMQHAGYFNKNEAALLSRALDLIGKTVVKMPARSGTREGVK